MAVIIALGAALYPATLAPDRLPVLAAPTVLFMLLCLANCLLISEWERKIDLSHGQTSLALRFSRSRTIAGGLPYGIFAISVGLAALSSGATRTAAGCGLASAALLAALNYLQPGIGRERAHLLADLALLTPWVAYLLA